MSIDWGLAMKIAGGGFGITILVLIVLALAAWLLGLVLKKITKGKKGGETEKGEA